jgi:hypothetical protein
MQGALIFSFSHPSNKKVFNYQVVTDRGLCDKKAIDGVIVSQNVTESKDFLGDLISQHQYTFISSIVRVEP